MDSQASAHGGIIVQVLGEMSNKGSSSQKFAQTFFLAEQPNGYYVLNDIFRFLKEDLEDEFEESEQVISGLPPASIATETIVAPVAPLAPVVPIVPIVPIVPVVPLSQNVHAKINENGINPNAQAVLPPKGLDKLKKEVKKVAEQTTQEPVNESRPKSPVKANKKESWSKPATSNDQAHDMAEIQAPKKVSSEKLLKKSSAESMKPKTWAIAAGTLASPAVPSPMPVVVSAPKPPTAPAPFPPPAPLKTQQGKSLEGDASIEKPTAKSPQSAQSQQSNGFHQVTNRRYENRRSSDQGNADGKLFKY